jgi:ABC-type Fe3+ transport system substrate-binding protein
LPRRLFPVNIASNALAERQRFIVVNGFKGAKHMSASRKMIAAVLGAAATFALAAPAHAVDQALIDAAKKEGSVTWYTALIINQFADPVAAAFQKKYGVKVEYVRANAAESILRISNEGKAGKVQADIFDGFGANQLVKEGLLESYIPDSAKRLPKEFVDPKGYWVATNLYILTPGYNTSLVPKGTEPKTYADLLDPKWKGKMAWGSNGSPSSASGFVGVVLADMGEQKGMDYLKKLAGQNIAPIPLAARQVLDQVIAGEYSIALQIFNNHTVISAAQGAPSAWIPMNPALGVLSVFSLTKNGPHKNAGKLLLDFMTSEDGQKIFREADYMPVDPAIPPKEPSLRPDGTNFRAIFFTPEQVEEKLPVWNKTWKDIFG